MNSTDIVNVPADECAANIAILEAGLYGREAVSKSHEFAGLTDFRNPEEVEQLAEGLRVNCENSAFSVETEIQYERIRFDQWVTAVLDRELAIGRADLACMNAIGGKDWPDSLRARLAIYREYRGLDTCQSRAA